MKPETFAGHELTYKVVDNEVYVTCKGVTGSLTEMLQFQKQNNPSGIYDFGKASMKKRNKNLLQVGCLVDTLRKGNEIVSYCLKLKDEKNE